MIKNEKNIEFVQFYYNMLCFKIYLSSYIQQACYAYIKKKNIIKNCSQVKSQLYIKIFSTHIQSKFIFHVTKNIILEF